MNEEDTREDLDFTGKIDMTLGFLSSVREKILDAIENHLDEYEPRDWGWSTKSNCAKTIDQLLVDEGATERHGEKLLAEAEKAFNTEMFFRLDIISIVDADRDDSHLG